MTAMWSVDLLKRLDKLGVKWYKSEYNAKPLYERIKSEYDYIDFPARSTFDNGVAAFCVLIQGTAYDGEPVSDDEFVAEVCRRSGKKEEVMMKMGDKIYAWDGEEPENSRCVTRYIAHNDYHVLVMFEDDYQHMKDNVQDNDYFRVFSYAHFKKYEEPVIKEFTLEEVAKAMGVDPKNIRIKDK